jgi:hypothetical protein
VRGPLTAIEDMSAGMGHGSVLAFMLTWAWTTPLWHQPLATNERYRLMDIS